MQLTGRKVLADHLNISISTVARYKKAGMPYTKGKLPQNPDTYDIEQIMRWLYINNIKLPLANSLTGGMVLDAMANLSDNN